MGSPVWLIRHIETYGFKYDCEKKKQVTYWDGKKYIFLPKGRTKLHERHVRDILKNKCNMTPKEIEKFIEKNRANIHS